MTPSILICGAQKCGTTSLHHCLVQHSLVTPARRDGRPVKEPHFFDRADMSPAEYLAMFSARRRRGSRGIDSTPNYMVCKDAVNRMHALLPHAQLVISLRNPVERAYSAWNHYTQELPRTIGFDWRAPGSSFRHNIAGELQQPFDEGGLVGQGRYAAKLRQLFALYDPEQVCVLIHERWTRQPQQTAVDLQKFLRLPREPIALRHTHARDYPRPIDPVARRMLAETLAPTVAELRELLADPLPEWSL